MNGVNCCLRIKLGKFSKPDKTRPEKNNYCFSKTPEFGYFVFLYSKQKKEKPITQNGHLIFEAKYIPLEIAPLVVHFNNLSFLFFFSLKIRVRLRLAPSRRSESGRRMILFFGAMTDMGE